MFWDKRAERIFKRIFADGDDGGDGGGGNSDGPNGGYDTAEDAAEAAAAEAMGGPSVDGSVGGYSGPSSPGGYDAPDADTDMSATPGLDTPGGGRGGYNDYSIDEDVYGPYSGLLDTVAGPYGHPEQDTGPAVDLGQFDDDYSGFDEPEVDFGPSYDGQNAQGLSGLLGGTGFTGQGEDDMPDVDLDMDPNDSYTSQMDDTFGGAQTNAELSEALNPGGFLDDKEVVELASVLDQHNTVEALFDDLSFWDRMSYNYSKVSDQYATAVPFLARQLIEFYNPAPVSVTTALGITAAVAGLMGQPAGNQTPDEAAQSAADAAADAAAENDGGSDRDPDQVAAMQHQSNNASQGGAPVIASAGLLNRPKQITTNVKGLLAQKNRRK